MTITPELSDAKYKFENVILTSSSGQFLINGAYEAGMISTVNSTSTPLAGDATFTGTADLSPHTDVIVTLKSDVAGTLYVDLSIDGTNWDTSIPFDCAAGAGEFHSIVKGSRYCRVRYVNGSSAQSYFRLQTEFGQFRQPNLSLNRALPADADAIAVRSTNVNHETALSRRSGAQTWHKFGRNTDVDTGAAEVVASFGGTFTPRTTGTTLSIVSTDVDDADADTGAHGIVIYGVDANWANQTEVVLLTGTTPVVTTSSWIGINRIAIYRAGTSLANEGTITVTAVTGGETMAEMPTGEGTSQQVIFHVKADAQALIDHINADVIRLAAGTQPVVTLALWAFSAVSNAKYRLGTYYIDGAIENHVIWQPQQPLQIGEKSAVWLEATTTVDNTSCAGRIVLTVYDNPTS